MIKRDEVFIAGITRIADFPFNPVMAIKFSLYVDHLVLGFDCKGGYGKYNNTNYISGEIWYELFKRVKPFPASVSVDMFKCSTHAGARNMGDHFLEELLRRLDGIKPDFVLECEADAHFDYGPDFDKDLLDFINSDADMWMMASDVETIDNRNVPNPWSAPHCRGYRWYPGIYYRNGFCQIQPVSKSKNPRMDGWLERKLPNSAVENIVPKRFTGTTRLKHYPIFTKQMEEERWKYYGKSHVKHAYKWSNLECPDLSWLDNK